MELKDIDEDGNLVNGMNNLIVVAMTSSMYSHACNLNIVWLKVKTKVRIFS